MCTIFKQREKIKTSFFPQNTHGSTNPNPRKVLQQSRGESRGILLGRFGNVTFDWGNTLKEIFRISVFFYKSFFLNIFILFQIITRWPDEYHSQKDQGGWEDTSIAADLRRKRLTIVSQLCNPTDTRALLLPTYPQSNVQQQSLKAAPPATPIHSFSTRPEFNLMKTGNLFFQSVEVWK